MGFVSASAFRRVRGLFGRTRPSVRPGADDPPGRSDDGAPPTVSIIIPCYNVESYVRRCHDSIAAEPIDGLEIIFIDDVSLDGTKAAIRSIDDPRIRLVESDSKGFAGGARNRGMAAATGKYLYFVDADDLLVTGGLSRLVAVAEEDGADVTMGARERVRIDGRRRRGAPDLHRRERRRRRASSFRGGLTKIAACHGRLYRTSFIREHGLVFPAGRRWDDTVFTFAVWAKDPLVSVISDLCYEYLDRGDGTQETSQLLSEASVRDRLSQISDHFVLYRSPEAARCVSRGRDHKVEFGNNLMHHLSRLHLCEDRDLRLKLATMIADFSRTYRDGILSEVDRLAVLQYRLLWRGAFEDLWTLNRAIDDAERSMTPAAPSDEDRTATTR